MFIVWGTKSRTIAAGDWHQASKYSDPATGCAMYPTLEEAQAAAQKFLLLPHAASERVFIMKVAAEYTTPSEKVWVTL